MAISEYLGVWEERRVLDVESANSGQSFLGLGSANISSIRSRAQQTKTKRDTLQKQSG